MPVDRLGMIDKTWYNAFNISVLLHDQRKKGIIMTKTSEFLTLIRNYRGIMGTIRFDDVWFTFDSGRFSYYDDDDEIQFLLSGQEGLVSVKHIVSYEKMGDDEELFEDAFCGYRATLSTGKVAEFYCFNPRNH